MNRINLMQNFREFRSSATRNPKSLTTTIRNNAGPLVFAAVLIVCSLAVGCSSEKQQPVSISSPAPLQQTAQSQPSNTLANNNVSAPQAENKPAPKKIVKKRPATVTYTDKTYGVNFVYPRRYAIETGDAAKEVLLSSPVPMNFVQPGGTALAAVELPDTGFANTDFDSAFFNVSINNTLTEEQCRQFAVPQTNVADSTPHPEPTSADSVPKLNLPDSQSSKLMVGDMELYGTEAVSGEGTRQSDSKYFHVFENGACYEFALNVTTNAQRDALIKHVDRDKVFARLATILSTVQIEPLKTGEDKINAATASSAPSSDKPEEQKSAEQTSGVAKPEEQKATAGQKADVASADTAKGDAGSDSTVPSSQSAPVATTTPATPSSSDVAPQ